MNEQRDMPGMPKHRPAKMGHLHGEDRTAAAVQVHVVWEGLDCGGYTEGGMKLEKAMEALGIGISTLGGIKNMAQIIPMAETRDDLTLILAHMEHELQRALDYIDTLMLEADE